MVWHLCEEYSSYNYDSVYLQKCKDIKLLPLANRFELNDIVFFHKVVCNQVDVELPGYLTYHDGNSRLRSSHIDSLSFVSSITPKSSSNAFSKSFFYRTRNLWNQLPFEIRSITEPNTFKTKVEKYLWAGLTPDLDTSDSFS